MEKELKLIKALTQSSNELDFPKVNFTLEHPTDMSRGEYATNLALVVFARLDSQNKKRFQNPLNVAKALVAQLQKHANAQMLFQKIDVAEPGFINITLPQSYFIEQLNTILQKQEKFGTNTESLRKRAIVEYSSPNIAKPFTIGHLRSTIIGDVLGNLLEANGWEVMRDNHLGDWGTQFGKQIYALINLGEKNLDKNIQKISQSPNPVKDLVALYIEFHQQAEIDPSLEDKAREWFSRLESGDPVARDIWQQCISWSWQEFEKIYESLYLQDFSQAFNFGKGLGESFFEDKIGPVIDEIRQSGYLKTGKEGAQLFYFPNDKYPPAMILKKDGSTLYHTRDLATDKYRLRFKPDLIINEVGSEQSLYFQQLFEMEQLLGWYTKSQRRHVSHGLIRFKDKKMSTRKGNVIWLENLLKIAEEKAIELQRFDWQDEHDGFNVSSKSLKYSPASRKHFKGIAQSVNRAQKIAIGALKWNDLKRDAKLEIVFDWDEMLSMKGNSGPYLQYTYARGKSVLRNAIDQGLDIPDSIDHTVKNINDLEENLMRLLSRYPKVIKKAAQELSPHYLANYLYEIAQAFNSYYNKQIIISLDSTIQNDTLFRLNLTRAVIQVLSNGLRILGIPLLESM